MPDMRAGIVRLARALGATVLAVVVCVAALEGFLRAFHHEVLPQALSNEIASGYHDGWDGIYEFSSQMNCDLPKPHYARAMYYNGYRWSHRGDARGFRNAVDRPRADVLLLGDSMVYGHGLELPDTVASQLERNLGRPVANLGVQGASSHQEYQILKRWVGEMRPRYVFVFFLYNDVEDLTAYLTDEEMMRFVSAPADAGEVDYFDPAARVDAGGIGSVLRGSYAARAVSVLVRLIRRDLVGSANAAQLPGSFVGDRRMALALVFHEVALRRMKRIAEDHGAQFVDVLVYTGQPGPEAFYEEVLGRFCAEHDITVLSLHDAFVAAEARGEKLFLERDGHYAPAGAALAARVVADWITAHEASNALTPVAAPRDVP